jgi:hypothetical protein
MGRSGGNLRVVAATLIAALLLPAIASAQESEPAEATNRWAHYALVGLDVVIVRPIGCVIVVVGAVALVPVSLITWAAGGDVNAAAEVFVVVPTQDLVKRPLGSF